jgi:hypothetical protein
MIGWMFLRQSGSFIQALTFVIRKRPIEVEILAARSCGENLMLNSIRGEAADGAGCA